MTEHQRVPPNSEQAERALLGSILLDCTPIMELCVEHDLKPDDFYHPTHREIYECMESMARANKAIDLMTIQTALKKRDALEKVGGANYLTGLIDDTPTSKHAPAYVEEIVDNAVRRRLIRLCRDAEANAHDHEVSGREILESTLSILHDHAEVKASQMSNCDALVKKLKEWKLAKKGEPAGVPWFLPEVQDVCGPAKYGKPYFIAAAPGRGKSTFMGNQAKFLAVNLNVPVGIVSIEMDHEELLGRIVCEMADVSAFALDTGMIPGDVGRNGMSRIDKVMDAAKVIVDENTGDPLVPLYITDEQMNIDQFAVWCRLMVRRHGLKQIWVDYIQIMDSGRQQFKTERERLNYLGSRLRQLSKELKVPICVLSQLTDEGGKGGRPEAWNLFGSRALEQSAYAIVMLYYEDDEFYVDVQKNRGGMTGRRVVSFDKSRQRMGDNHGTRPIEADRRQGAEPELNGVEEWQP